MDEVEVLTALLEEYSPSGEEGGAVPRFLDLSRDLGLEGRSDAAGNGIASIGDGPPTVLFLGHIDTVEGALPIRLVDGRLMVAGRVMRKVRSRRRFSRRAITQARERSSSSPR